MKIRPAVVIDTDSRGFVRICPVTSRIPYDSSNIPLELNDFEKGGLSLFDESYILISEISRVRKNEIAGKKGRLTEEKISIISSRIALF
jgi:mRNA-degrading endonuclease toxin of MazEF toxin-antitoxin module